MAGRIKVIEIIEEKWIHTPFFSVPANSRSEVEVPDYSPNDADREWVKTQIGDVPARWVHGHRTMDDFTTVQQGVDLGCAHIGDTNTYQLPGPYLP